jgi:hypothetical protein
MTEQEIKIWCLEHRTEELINFLKSKEAEISFLKKALYSVYHGEHTLHPKFEYNKCTQNINSL